MSVLWCFRSDVLALCRPRPPDGVHQQVEHAVELLAAARERRRGQNSCSVLDRTDEPVLDACREHGIAWVPFFPLGSAGYGTFRTVTGDPTVTAIASELAVTPAQVALAWLLAHYDDTLLIPGTATPAHLTENIAAGSLRLPPTAFAALDQLAEPGASRS